MCADDLTLDRLKLYDWYLPHQAWLKSIGSSSYHDPEDAQPHRANLAWADLTDAYLIGANLAGADLTNASLIYADLVGANLAGTNLAGANLMGAYLIGTNFTGANFTGADLTDANLSRVRLREAVGLPPAPVVIDIDRAILEAIGDGSTFDMTAWHSECRTTHCRAGWAIELAGKEGYALEARLGPSVAGALIYNASRPGVDVPNFICSTRRALADLRRCAKP